MKNIVIFGGSGAVGRYFVNYFLENIDDGNDYQLYVVGSRERTLFLEYEKVTYVAVDISQKDQFEVLPKTNVVAVVHLAGMMPARMKGYDPYKYIDVNITGTLNILEYCRERKVERILFSQSFGDIKDNAEKDLILKANMERNFSYTTDHTVYVLSKNMAVDLIENYYQMYNIKRFIFRLPTIYLYEKDDCYYVDGEQRKIGYRLLIQKAQMGEDIEVWGDASRVKDMIYVKDLCQMMFRALFVNCDGGVYNAGTGIGISLLEQIKGIIKVFGKEEDTKLIFREDKPNAPQYIMDITEAKRDLGYEPKYDYISMLQDMKKEMESDLDYTEDKRG